MKKRIIFIGLLFSFAFSFSQKNFNNYKYVVVPIQFDFLKGQDQYRTSSLTKFLFKELGVETYFDVQELPEELFENRCKALYADVKKIKGGFLRTDIQITLKDCIGNIIEVSKIASTKEKEYKEAYRIAITEAFESFKFLGYNYEPVEDEILVKNVSKASKPIIEENQTDSKLEIESLKKEIEELKEQKRVEAISAVDSSMVKIEKAKPAITVKKEEIISEKVSNTKSQLVSDLLYAQKIEGGFQLVDSEPKKVMVLLNTAAPSVYSVKGKDAIVFNKDGQWVYSENTGTSKIEKVLNIKF